MAYIFPPNSFICRVTTASPIQTIAKTPEKTSDFCSPLALIDRSKLSSKLNKSGPLEYNSIVSRAPTIPAFATYHKSQSLSPSLIPACKTTSASGHLPIPSTLPPSLRLSPSPLSAAPMPPPRCKMPPRRYFGHNTSLIFSHTASRSRDSVSHTLSSIVFVGARRSSPGIEEVR